MSTSSDSNGVLSLLQGRAPQYRDAHDAVMFAIHTHLLRKGLVCHALTPPASPSPADLQRELPVVPPGWNGGDDAYSFTYHQQRAAAVAVIVVLKAVKMGQTLLLHAITQRLPAAQQPSVSASSASGSVASPSSAAVKDEVPVSLEVNVTDYVNTGASLSDYRALYRDLAGLLLLFDSQLGSRIIPTAAAADSRAAVVPESQARDPLRFPPRNPLLADDDDDDDDRLRDLRGRPQRGDFDDDLNPLAVGGPMSGNLMGPRNFPGMAGGPQGVRPGGGLPGLAPRYDPYGPVPGMGEPDFDELVPPGLPLPGGNRGPRGPFGGGLGRGGGFGGGGGAGGGPFL